MKTYKILVVNCVFLFMCFGQVSAQSYQNYSEDFCIIFDFITSGSGGGCVYVDLVNDVLTVRFSGGFTPTTLKTGKIKYLSTSPQLPDMTMGNLNQGNYIVSIEDGWLKISGSDVINGFGITLTKNVPPPVPLDLTGWLLSPNGGEVFNVGDEIPIVVNTALLNSAITVQLYKGNELVKSLGIAGTEGRIISTSDITGFSSDYKVKISSPGGDLYDWSNDTFTINDYSDWLTSPNGGESFIRGESIPVSINPTLYDPGTNLAVEVYGANGVFKFYGPEVGGITGRVINTTSPSFTIGTAHKIKVYDANDPTKFDWSDGTFTVTLESADLINPVDGESYHRGDICSFNWSIVGDYSSYDLILKHNGVEQLKILENAVSGTSTQWIVPNNLALDDQYTIQLHVDYPGGRVVDVISGVFSIVTHPLSDWLISPAGGEQFNIGEDIPVLIDEGLLRSEALVLRFTKELNLSLGLL